MKCPFCNQDNTRVVDSRPADDNTAIRRRRMCDACGKRFTTYEKVETIPLIVIKKDQNREQFDRSKIEAGVLRACHKRPVSAEQIHRLVDDVETEPSLHSPFPCICTLFSNEILSQNDLNFNMYSHFMCIYTLLCNVDKYIFRFF